MMAEGKQMMVSMELQKNPNFFNEIEHYCVDTMGYSRGLFNLTKLLLSYQPRDRPSAAKTIKILDRIMENFREDNIKLSLQSFNTLNPTSLKLNVFAFLSLEDMYHVALCCKEFFKIWEEEWFKNFVTSTSIGKEITNSNAAGTKSRKSRSNSTKSRASSDIAKIGNGLFDNNIFKTQVYNYVKIHKPRTRRDRNKRGKNVVSEIHPGQIEEAAKFLVNVVKHSDNNPLQKLFIEAKLTNSTGTGSSKSTSTSTAEDSPALIIPTTNNSPFLNWNSLLKHIFNVESISEIAEDALLFLCTLLLKYGIKYGRVYVNIHYSLANQDKEIQAISIWQDPYNTKGIGLWRMLKLGILKSPKSL